jgi:hypothetical protein
MMMMMMMMMVMMTMATVTAFPVSCRAEARCSFAALSVLTCVCYRYCGGGISPLCDRMGMSGKQASAPANGWLVCAIITRGDEDEDGADDGDDGVVLLSDRLAWGVAVGGPGPVL